MLYTRKGDGGTTGTFGCDQRISKSSAIAEALGALDEANSYLGLCRAHLQTRGVLAVPYGKRTKPAETIVYDIQETLFIIQAEVAGAPKKVSKQKVSMLEQATDCIERALPPIRSFSIPGATHTSALFDVARTLARRAERRVIAAQDEGVRKVSQHTLAYLNRLSSLLFALARYANHVESVEEEAPTYR